MISPSVFVHAIAHARRRGQQLEIELALQPLLDDLHVQQAEKAAAESEAEGERALRLVAERGVVELQLADGVAQVLVVVGVDREDAGEDHRLHFLEAGQRLRRSRSRR